MSEPRLILTVLGRDGAPCMRVVLAGLCDHYVIERPERDALGSPTWRTEATLRPQSVLDYRPNEPVYAAPLRAILDAIAERGEPLVLP